MALAPPGGAKPRQLPPAPPKSISVASVWETTASLTHTQEGAVDLVSQHCHARPFPSQVDQESTSTGGPLSDSSTEPEADAFRGSLEDTVLHSANQFHRWHLELEAARVAETEGKYQQYADTLQQHLSSCRQLQEQVAAALALCERLKEQYWHVSGSTKAHHDACEGLVAEREKLVAFASILRSKLAFFEQLDSIAAYLHSPQAAGDASKFLPMLQRLDECIVYVTSHPQYADASAYAGKFRQLQARAMAAIRSQVQQVLRTACAQVQAAVADSQAGRPRRSSSGAVSLLRGGSGLLGLGRRTSSASEDLPAPEASSNGHAPSGPAANGLPLAERAEATLLYVRFRAAAEPGLRGLLLGIEERAQRAEYRQLLADCQAAYCAARLALVADVTRARIAALSREPLPALTRSGCAYLMQVCVMEQQLFQHFFPKERGESGAVAPLVDPLCTILYDMLRPAIIQLSSLDQLCELIAILQHEVLDEQLARRGDAAAPLRPALLRMVADVQHRLIFRAQAFIKETVAGFHPSADDLDYPGKLQRHASQPVNGQANAADADSMKESAMADYSTWYPPVQQTLLCLSKLYSCVEHKVFAGLAQDAIAACTEAVQAGSKAVAKRASIMDGELFFMKQLLILREQMVPFDAEFSVVEKDLDFTHMRDYLRRILAGQASLFSLSYDNAVYQMLSKGGPRILENQVDSKREVEKLVKAACEAFIMALTKAAVEAMLSFITKVTAVRVARPASGTAKPLREQAFASPERVGEMVGKVREALRSTLPAAVARLKLYVKSPATHAVLLRPIKSNIVEAHSQVATLLASEYAPEEVQAINLPGAAELAHTLDSLLG